jgi:uncharacterized protein YcfJ|tara:strand:+ start:4852 stop:5355 length:504 start_codon:yes stop_codon:yes gene_type:complete
MKTLLASAAIFFVANTATAQTQYATVTKVVPQYETVWMNTPRTQCQDIEVPIYGTMKGNGASAGDVLGGMIIGGLLGKGVTGKDNGAAAGAVLGGMIAADQKDRSRQIITGYRIERQCNEVMVREQQNTIKNYRITYSWNGVVGKSYTYNNYREGDQISVMVSIVAQ